MAAKWLVGTNTKEGTGPAFRTKKAAIAWGREHFSGVFFVWKARVLDWKGARV